MLNLPRLKKIGAIDYAQVHSNFMDFRLRMIGTAHMASYNTSLAMDAMKYSAVIKASLKPFTTLEAVYRAQN